MVNENFRRGQVSEARSPGLEAQNDRQKIVFLRQLSKISPKRCTAHVCDSHCFEGKIVTMLWHSTRHIQSILLPAAKVRNLVLCDFPTLHSVVIWE